MGRLSTPRAAVLRTLVHGSEALSYALTVVAINFLFMIMAARKWVQEDLRIKVRGGGTCVPRTSCGTCACTRGSSQPPPHDPDREQTMSAFDEASTSAFSKATLCFWDHSLTRADEVRPRTIPPPCVRTFSIVDGCSCEGHPPPASVEWVPAAGG